MPRNPPRQAAASSSSSAAPPQYVLAVKPRTAGRRPTRYLTDLNSHPLQKPTTRKISLARVWADGSGPRHYLRHHPELRAKFMPWRVLAVLARPTAPRRRRVPATAAA